MFSKEFSYKDLKVHFNGLSGKVDVTCRNLVRKDITAEELLELAYPGIDAQAALEAAQGPQQKT